MRISRLLSPLALVLLLGCHRKPQQQELADFGQALPNIPLPPDPQPLVREVGVDAVQFVVLSGATPDSVIAYYRRVLAVEPFRLVNERHSGNTTAFYAEQAGPSIWVTVSPNGTAGSQVIIAGAKDPTKPPVTDSAGATKAHP